MKQALYITLIVLGIILTLHLLFDFNSLFPKVDPYDYPIKTTAKILSQKPNFMMSNDGFVDYAQRTGYVLELEYTISHQKYKTETAVLFTRYPVYPVLIDSLVTNKTGLIDIRVKRDDRTKIILDID